MSGRCDAICDGSVKAFFRYFDVEHLAYAVDITLFVLNVLGLTGALGPKGNMLLGVANTAGGLASLALHRNSPKLRDGAIDKVHHTTQAIASVVFGILGICGSLPLQTVAISALITSSGLLLASTFAHAYVIYKKGGISKTLPISELIPLVLLIINALSATGVFSGGHAGWGVGLINFVGGGLYAYLGIKWINDNQFGQAFSEDKSHEIRKKFYTVALITSIALGLFGFCGMKALHVGMIGVVVPGAIQVAREIYRPIPQVNRKHTLYA